MSAAVVFIFVFVFVFVFVLYLYLFVKKIELFQRASEQCECCCGGDCGAFLQS